MDVEFAPGFDAISDAQEKAALRISRNRNRARESRAIFFVGGFVWVLIASACALRVPHCCKVCSRHRPDPCETNHVSGSE